MKPVDRRVSRSRVGTIIAIAIFIATWLALNLWSLVSPSTDSSGSIILISSAILVLGWLAAAVGVPARQAARQRNLAKAFPGAVTFPALNVSNVRLQLTRAAVALKLPTPDVGQYFNFSVVTEPDAVHIFYNGLRIREICTFPTHRISSVNEGNFDGSLRTSATIEIRFHGAAADQQVTLVPYRIRFALPTGLDESAVRATLDAVRGAIPVK
jgi:hypothetical protein